MRDDGMADIQLGNFGYRGNRLHIGVMQSMARVYLQAMANTCSNAGSNTLELSLLLFTFGIRVATRM